MAIINEETSYRELKQSIRMIKSQKNDTEKFNLIEEDTKKQVLMKLLNAVKVLIIV